MDGREGMALQGSDSYYNLHRIGIAGSDGSGAIPSIHGAGYGSALKPTREVPSTTVYKTLSTSNSSVHHNVGISGICVRDAGFHVENASDNYSHGVGMAFVSSSSLGADSVMKKKRGRPRKYAPDGSNKPLKSSRLSCSEGFMTAEKPRKGRPPGTGWKQKLAPLGEWMNSSAGLAFAPHVLHIGAGEDIAAKILVFAQQRPRALCILSANGSVSAVTLRQPTTSAGAVTYEGRFQILCLSGSYLLAESGSPHNRTGGISISVCSLDGHILGGAIGGRLIAASPVQVVACSFVYDGTGTKAKNDSVSESKNEQSVAPRHPNASETSPRPDIKSSEPKFDLASG